METKESKESKDDDIETGSVESYIDSENGSRLAILGIRYFKNDFGCFPCINKYSLNDFKIVYNAIIHLKTLDVYQKNIVLVRFNRICHFINREYFFIKWCYTLSKLFVIMTGIIAPALLSINVQTNTFWYPYIYWLVWVIQVMVSLITSFASFYKWDKKYFIYKAYKTKIEQELWLYLELIGRYGIINKKCPDENKKSRTTHKTKLNLFLSRLEILFKRLKDADLDIEITEEDNQSKEGENTRPTTIINTGTETDPLTDNENEENITQFLMSKKPNANLGPPISEIPSIISRKDTVSSYTSELEIELDITDKKNMILERELKDKKAANILLATRFDKMKEELRLEKIINECSKDLDSIILLQYAVRKFLKNKAKK